MKARHGIEWSAVAPLADEIVRALLQQGQPQTLCRLRILGPIRLVQSGQFAAFELAPRAIRQSSPEPGGEARNRRQRGERLQTWQFAGEFAATALIRKLPSVTPPNPSWQLLIE